MPMAKNYIKGSIRELEIKGTGDTRLIVSLLLEDLEKIVNDAGYVNVIIQGRREKDAFGNTHYAYENDYKPGEKQPTVSASVAAKKAGVKAPNYKEPLDDNPFV
jgi:hypothetical protein